MKEESCPICEHTDCDEFVVDLMVCNNCSHIFKKSSEMIEDDNCKYAHLYKDPVNSIRKIVDNIEESQMFDLIFPSMNFYSLDLHPTNFYNSNFNHYFNQMSIMIFLRRCRLKPIKQENVWNSDETMCTTKMICKRI